MSFLHPRTISQSRSGSTFSAADGASQTLTVIASGIPCTIDLKRPKGTSAPGEYLVKTNTDAPMPYFYISIPKAYSTVPNSFEAGDLIEDDAGMRYKTEVVWWTPIGTVLACEPYRPHS